MNLKILLAICIFVIVEAKDLGSFARHSNTSLCDSSYNNVTKVQCYCTPDVDVKLHIRSADCFLTNSGVSKNDSIWEEFTALRDISKLTFTSTRGIAINFIPTNAIKHLKAIHKLDIKYGNIHKIQANAFADSSTIEEIYLKDNRIIVLETNAIANHKRLTLINLEQNSIDEINRNVFVNLPSLEKLFLTSNKITTIHDRAFLHLTNMREMEINMNSLFSLNTETFSGLNKLQRLDLSNNNIEVIGDNTFIALESLTSLNLDSNKIQMLDARAFAGLSKLQSLSLAHNKLSQIDNEGVFTNLTRVISVSLRGNELIELKEIVMSPILPNLYLGGSNLDVEDNQFPCSCSLDWFLNVMNNTINKSLKIAIENLKCIPDPQLKEAYSKLVTTSPPEDEPPMSDYEYYDDSQLNGKVFYVDVRDLLNCTGPTSNYLNPVKYDDTNSIAKVDRVVTKTTASQTVTQKPIDFEHDIVFLPSTKHSSKATTVDKVSSQGLLDLALFESTTKNDEFTTKLNEGSYMSTEKKPTVYTTTRLATVSAKPIDSKIYENMASDEAKPYKRSFQATDHTPKAKENKAHQNLACLLPIVILCVKLIY